jgi:DNA mismatch repair protein MutS2
VEEQLETLEENIEAPVERRPTARALVASDTDLPPSVAAAMGKSPPWSARVGATVHLTYLNTEGLITALSSSDAEVQVGSVRVRVRLTDIEKPKDKDGGAGTKGGERRAMGHHDDDQRGAWGAAAPPSAPVRSSPGIELSLRGKLVEDGLDELERYLEKAYAAGLPFVRIVHGKGTGRMRTAVRAALKESPYVSSFEFGNDREGGDGVTVATLSR